MLRWLSISKGLLILLGTLHSWHAVAITAAELQEKEKALKLFDIDGSSNDSVDQLVILDSVFDQTDNISFVIRHAPLIDKNTQLTLQAVEIFHSGQNQWLQVDSYKAEYDTQNISVTFQLPASDNGNSPERAKAGFNLLLIRANITIPNSEDGQWHVTGLLTQARPKPIRSPQHTTHSPRALTSRARKPKAAVFDIDNTLVLTDIDTKLLIHQVADKAREYASHGYAIFYVTARPWFGQRMTRELLISHHLPPGSLLMSDLHLQQFPPDQIEKQVVTMKRKLIHSINQHFDVRTAYGDQLTDVAAYMQTGVPKFIHLEWSDEPPTTEVMTVNHYQRRSLTPVRHSRGSALHTANISLWQNSQISESPVQPNLNKRAAVDKPEEPAIKKQRIDNSLKPLNKTPYPLPLILRHPKKQAVSHQTPASSQKVDKENQLLCSEILIPRATSLSTQGK